MKFNLYRYFFLFTVFSFCFLASRSSISADLKICNEGIEKCQSFIQDASEYKACMRVACKDYYDEQEFKKIQLRDKIKKDYQKELEKLKDKRPLEQVKSCDYGLRKCDALSYNKEYYFECINTSCKNEDETAKPNCKTGLLLCESEKAKYQECLGYFCPKNSKSKECKRGKKACKLQYKSFWRCVYAICLGPVEHFKKPAKTRKFMMVDDKKTGKKRRVIIGKKTKTSSLVKSPLDRNFIEQGIDPREAKSITPQKFRIYGNPSDSLYCSSGVLRCESQDVRSCICTNGTMPIYLNAPPDPRFTTK